MKDNIFTIQFKDFFQGYSPLAHIDNLTEKGNSGHASIMLNADVLNGKLTQGPTLSNLTGTLDQLIRYILDTPVSDNLTYGIGTTKVYSITATTLTAAKTITDCTEGQSIAYLKGDLFYFYNTASAGGIGKFVSPTWTDNWNTTLQKALHPVETKEDIMLFGNGRYVGTYVKATDTLTVDKLDFGTGHEVADVAFNANYWYIAVNGGTTGTNRSTGQIYLYDGAATESILADETGIGFQRIGFIYVLNGIVYVAYQDLSSTGGYHIGYVAGRQIKRLASFTGGLPTFKQKTLYKGTLLFVAGGSIWSCGAISPDLPIQISQIADGGYSTVGALAAPFGTPIVGSTESTNYRLSKFSGYDTSSYWKSIIIPTVGNRIKGYIDSVVVQTNSLGANAKAALTIEADQATRTSNSKVIETTGKMTHNFDTLGLGAVSDLRLVINFSNGNATNNAVIRNVLVKGHYLETN